MKHPKTLRIAWKKATNDSFGLTRNGDLRENLVRAAELRDQREASTVSSAERFVGRDFRGVFAGLSRYFHRVFARFWEGFRRVSLVEDASFGGHIRL
jgi:hypothetical protein